MRHLLPLSPLVLVLALSAGGCSQSGGHGDSGGSDPAVSINGITPDNAEPLTRSALDMVSKIVTIGDMATYLVDLGKPVLDEPHTPVPLPAISGASNGCTGGSGIEANEISYQHYDPGYPLPPGDVLHVPMVNCYMEGYTVQDSIVDIAEAAVTTNDTTGAWRYEGLVDMESSLNLLNGNLTSVSITDKLFYTASLDVDTNIVTTTLEIDHNPDVPSIQDGLNATYTLGSATVYYQLLPFYIVTQDDGNANSYTVSIQNNPGGAASQLDRYTQGANSGEIELQVSTPTPIHWSGGKPASYTDVPDAGVVLLTEQNCGSCGNSVTATVKPEGVELLIQSNGGSTTRTVDWATLLTAPDPPT